MPKKESLSSLIESKRKIKLFELRISDPRYNGLTAKQIEMAERFKVGLSIEQIKKKYSRIEYVVRIIEILLEKHIIALSPKGEYIYVKFDKIEFFEQNGYKFQIPDIQTKLILTTESNKKLDRW